jgi:hypothetical protein
MTNTITYRSDFPARDITLPIGRDNSISRESGCSDICLSRAVAIDCPLVVTILIRTNGDVALWHTAWSGDREPNTYWHFSAGSDADAAKRHPTDAQLATLERIFLKLAPLPGEIGGALGQPVAAWAFEGLTPGDIATRHGVKTPIMA